MRFLVGLVSLVALVCSVAYGQIKVPPESSAHTPIVATITAQMPEGATFDGGWKTGDGVHVIPVADGAVHIWARPGKHSLEYSGFWLHLKEITFKDGDGNDITITSYLGHGFINEEAEFSVLGGTDPPPDPPGPLPGQKYQLVLFVAADNLDQMDPSQRHLVTSLNVRTGLREHGHHLVQVIDNDQIREGVPTKWVPFVEAVMGDALPRVAIAPVEGGAVSDYPLPANYLALLKFLEDPK